MNLLLNILLMAPTQGGETSYTQFIPLILIVVVFYFFMIRPQMKKQKDLRKFREDLKKGDKIVTTGGIYGKIHEIKDNVVIIEVEGNNKLKIDKAAVLKDMADAQK